MKRNGRFEISNDAKYLNCGCERNCISKEEDSKYGNHKYPFDFFISFDIEYEDLKGQIELFFLKIEDKKGDYRSIKNNTEYYDFELYFDSIDTFRNFVYEVLEQHNLKPRDKGFHSEEIKKRGINSRSLLLNAHDVMHNYVNKGLS